MKDDIDKLTGLDEDQKRILREIRSEKREDPYDKNPPDDTKAMDKKEDLKDTTDGELEEVIKDPIVNKILPALGAIAGVIGRGIVGGIKNTVASSGGGASGGEEEEPILEKSERLNEINKIVPLIGMLASNIGRLAAVSGGGASDDEEGGDTKNASYTGYDFDDEERKIGMRVETEFTDDNKEAEDSVENHLKKDPKHYSRLRDVLRADEDKPLNKPMRDDGDKKFKVYVKDPNTGNIVTVRFGDPNMEIKRDDPERRASFRARHDCANAKDITTPKYWSCKMWEKGTSVTDQISKKDKDEFTADDELGLASELTPNEKEQKDFADIEEREGKELGSGKDVDNSLLKNKLNRAERDENQATIEGTIPTSRKQLGEFPRQKELSRKIQQMNKSTALLKDKKGSLVWDSKQKKWIKENKKEGKKTFALKSLTNLRLKSLSLKTILLKRQGEERGKEILTGSPSTGITSTRNVAEGYGDVHHRFNTTDRKGNVTQQTHKTPTDKITNPLSNGVAVKPYKQKLPKNNYQSVPTKRGYTPNAITGTEQNRRTPKSGWTHDQKLSPRGSLPTGTPKPKGQGALGKLTTLFRKKP